MSAIKALNNRVFLGNEDDARNLELLQSYAITHVISLTQSVYYPDKFSYYPINIDDIPIANIYQYFEPCVEFINDALAAPEGQNVLVHCAAGVSRSASIVIAYLMSAQRVDYETALALVRADRHFICPNAGFVLQLRQWQMALGVPYCKSSTPSVCGSLTYSSIIDIDSKTEETDYIWRSMNGKVVVFNESALFKVPRENMPPADRTIIFSRYFMQDGIGGYKVELINTAAQTAFTGFAFPQILVPAEDYQPKQIIICTDRVLMSFVIAKCLRTMGLDFSEILAELQKARCDTSPYIRQQLELLCTGASKDLAHERLGLLATYATYMNTRDEDRLWGLYDLLLRFENWAIPEVLKAQDELVFALANRLGLDTRDDEFEYQEAGEPTPSGADATHGCPEPEPSTESQSTPDSGKLSDLEEEPDEDI